MAPIADEPQTLCAVDADGCPLSARESTILEAPDSITGNDRSNPRPNVMVSLGGVDLCAGSSASRCEARPLT